MCADVGRGRQVDRYWHTLLGRETASSYARPVPRDAQGIDSLGDLRAACKDELRSREYMYSLLQRCALGGISLMMPQEVPELFGLTHLSEYGISHLSDNVVLLQFLRGNSEVKRAISVLKTRGSAHDPRIRHFEITSDGLSLGDPFLPDQSLL